MGRLAKVEKYTELILEEKPQTRDSDNLLYLEYLRSQGVEVDKITLEYFFLNLHHTSLSSYECVGRVRRRVQNKREELKGTPLKRAIRKENEQYMRGWAING